METSETAKQKNGEFQHFVDYCFKHVDACEESEYRGDKIELIRKAWMAYKQKADNANFPWKDASNTVLPLVTITSDNLEPRLVSNLVGKEPYARLEMDGITQQPDEVKIIEDWFNQELKHTVKIDSVARNVCKKAALEGTMYPVVGYDEDEVIRRDFAYAKAPVMDPNTGMPAMDPMGMPVMQETGDIEFDPETGRPMTVDVAETIFSGGRVKYVAFSDVFVTDDAEDWENADVARRVYYTYAELQKKIGQPGWMNIDADLLKSESTDREKTEDQQSPDESVDNARVRAQDYIECYECSMHYVRQEEDQEKEDITDWTMERYLAVIAVDSRILIRLVPLREVNFKNEHLIKRVRLYPEEGKAYGTSLYEKMQAIQHGASDLFNMVINVATITMIPWFLYSDDAGFAGEVEIKPGKGVKCNDPSKVVFPRFNQNPRSYMVFIEMFMSLWERLGSIGDLQVGRLSQTKKDVTATETMAAIQEGNIKHNYQGMSLKEDFLAVIHTLYDLYYQNMPFDKKFAYRGQEVPIPRHLMRRRYRFELTGSTDFSNKVMKMQKAETKYTTLRQDPMLNPIPLIADYLESYDDDLDPQQYINPMVMQIMSLIEQNPELPQMMQMHVQGKQQQQMQMQQQQQQDAATTQGRAIAEALLAKIQEAQSNPQGVGV